MIAEEVVTDEVRGENKDAMTSPIDIYRERAGRFKRDFDAQTERWNRIGNFRLVTFLAAAVAIIWGFLGEMQLLWVAGIVLLLGFFVLVWYHNRVGRARKRAEELYKINSEAIMRVERRWDDLPLRHKMRARPGDPYAGDLDIFGPASLMHLLETVGTFMGEATLASWLQSPDSPIRNPQSAIRNRQSAVQELAPLIDLRDELTLRGRLMGDEKPDPAPFLAWAEAVPWLAARPWLPMLALGSVLLLWGSLSPNCSG
jgi:hypothetical protein